TPPKGGKSGSPDPAAAKDQQATKILQAAAKPLAALKNKGALTSVGLNQELAKIKAQVSGIDFGVQLKGSKWAITPKAGERAGKALEVDAQVPPGAAAGADRITIQIAMSGAIHTIEAIGTGSTIKLFMATRREELAKKLAGEADRWVKSEDPDLRSNGQQLAARLAAVRQHEDALSAAYAAEKDNVKRHAIAVEGVNKIGSDLVMIANTFGITVEDEDIPGATPFRASGLNLGRATGAYVDPVTVMSLRPPQPRYQFAPGGRLNFPGRDKYAAGHLIADTFGGPNAAENLSLISRRTNGRFNSREGAVRSALRGTKKIPEPS